jgi:hypothetical protein
MSQVPDIGLVTGKLKKQMTKDLVLDDHCCLPTSVRGWILWQPLHGHRELPHWGTQTRK